MNQLQRVFNYHGNGVRIIVRDGEPWFVAADVCRILELGNSGQAISRLEEDEKSTIILNDGSPGNPNYAIVDEPGLYSLVLSSRKAEAKTFKRWVTHEVLPTIRKTGSYHQIPQTYPEALRLAADLAEENQRLLPKAEMHDLFLSADNCQSMNVVAKSLGTGRTRLFQFLRDKEILMTNNTPYQDYLDRGYFRVVEKPIVMGDQAINKPQTFVTAKGVDYIGRLMGGSS